MTSDKLRSEFLNFFKRKNHKIVSSASLIPRYDPTLLFTGAGMNQFKDQFLGRNITFTRAATCQKCLRTADLDKVARSSGHHTFFEMLGNFSFGDYFKKEAIGWAWEFLTQAIKLPKENLWTSVYEEDNEAYCVWKDLSGIPESKIIKLGDKENFWPSEAKKNGPNGPCGPCSEIFYDWGSEQGCKKSTCNPSCECGRFVEVWNLVFTQFNRIEGARLIELPKKNIDTGMGLERLAAVKEQVRTNFQIDTFRLIIKAISGQLHYKYGIDSHKDSHVNAIADHIRSITFAIGDGVRPSNESRGFVIRKLIRRTSQRARSIGAGEPFIYKIIPVVIKVMKGAYPELARIERDIAQIVLKEEESLMDILDTVLPNLEEEFREIKKRGDETIPSSILFKYYDEKGIPLDLIEEKASLHKLAMEVNGFNRLLDEQRKRSRTASKIDQSIFAEKFFSDKRTEFVPDKTSLDAKIIAISKENNFVHVVLDRTVFYGEAGGQVGDKGLIEGGDFAIAVLDAKKYEDTIDHIGKIIKGDPKENDEVSINIDAIRRSHIARNHTATHLLHAALKKILGRHANQYGSLVAPERLRFDFTHPSKLNLGELEKIEETVNDFISSGHDVDSKQMTLEAAKNQGAVALFGEKYKDKVTVKVIGSISKELCGGTHVKNTNEIGVFKIISESSVASGIRRIEAVTGKFVYDWMKNDIEKHLNLYRDSLNNIKSIADEGVRVSIKKIEQYMEEKLIRIDNLLDKDSSKLTQSDVGLWIKTLRPELVRTISDLDTEASLIQKKDQKQKKSHYISKLDDIIKEARLIAGVSVISKEIEGANIEDLRTLVDMIKKTSKNTVIVLAASTEARVNIIFSLTEDLVSRGLDASRLIKEIASVVSGSGGGRPDLAQAGGKSPERLKEALGLVYEITRREVSK